jgi:hypothetical protein
MWLIAPLHLVDRETRGGIDGVRRFGARVPKSLVRRSLALGKCKSRTSFTELETDPSVVAMQRRKCDNLELQIPDGKNTLNSTEQKSILLPEQYGKINK